MLASSHAPHPSAFTVPTTQNTAPVVEHRCLYTHDLRRKQKRWQDGILKFHTFNNRVMVYDVPRNYIGDTHWRESDRVQDGDEIELDRGVLIQVGEVLGKVDQDLSELLERRKRAPDLPTNRKDNSKSASMNDSRAVVTQPSQILRPKPLNEILGTRKGHIGRASIPTKSPHDLRAELEASPRLEERQSKRRRVEEPPKPQFVAPPRPAATNLGTKKAVPHNLRTVDNEATPTSKSVRAPKASSGLKSHATLSNDRSGHLNVPPIVASLSVESHHVNPENLHPEPKQATEAMNDPVQVISSQEDNSRKVHQMRRSRCSQNRSRQNTSSSGANLPRSDAAPASEARPQPSNIERSEDRNLEPSGKAKARARLQVAPRKSRKKLMYRDLLPQALSREKMKQNDTDKSVDLLRKTRKKLESLSSLHQAERDQLDARLERQYARKFNAGIVADLPTPVTSSTDHHKSKRKIQVSCGSTAASDQSRRSPLSSIEQYIQPLPRPSTTLHDTNTALAKMDEILFSRSQVTSKQTRHLLPPHHNPSDEEGGPRSPSASSPKPLANPQRIESRSPQSKTQIPSSPGFQGQYSQATLAAARAPQAARHITVSTKPNKGQQDDIPPINKDEDLIESSQPITPKTFTSNPADLNPVPPPQSPPLEPPSSPSPLPPINHSPPQNPPNPKPKTLPTFKQPTRRSPFKKTVSDTSSMRPPPLAAITSADIRPAQAVSNGGTEQVGEAWSKEAWDIFGCGRDGVRCSFADFVGQGK